MKVCPTERHLTWNVDPYPPSVEVLPRDCGKVIGEDEFWYRVELDDHIVGVTEQGAQEEPDPEFRPQRLTARRVFLDKKKARIMK